MTQMSVGYWGSVRHSWKWLLPLAAARILSCGWQEQGDIEYLVQFAKFATAGGYPQPLGRGAKCVQLFCERREAAGGEEVQLDLQRLARDRLGSEHLGDGCHPDHRLRR